VSQGAADSLEAARAAVTEACEEAERLLADAAALRHAADVLRRRFDRQGVRWEGSPEHYSFEKALQPVAERLYDLGGGLFRLCHDHGCTVFDAQTRTTRAVNTIGEQAMAMRRSIAEAGFGEEPPPWQDRDGRVPPADPLTGLPPELADLPSLRWAEEQDAAARVRGRRARHLVAGTFVLLGAAGASVSGILSRTEGGVGLLFALVLAASGGWCAGTLVTAVWRRLRHYRLMRRPSMRLLARFQRSFP
jgi:hypothetical protein